LRIGLGPKGLESFTPNGGTSYMKNQKEMKNYNHISLFSEKDLKEN
jgi:hypothetical protein